MPAIIETNVLLKYLFRRLKEVGVKSIHGVPGDYNLVALDYIPKLGLQWVGNCNELNAGIIFLPTKPTIQVSNISQDTPPTDTPASTASPRW